MTAFSSSSSIATGKVCSRRRRLKKNGESWQFEGKMPESKLNKLRGQIYLNTFALDFKTLFHLMYLVVPSSWFATRTDTKCICNKIGNSREHGRRDIMNIFFFFYRVPGVWLSYSLVPLVLTLLAVVVVVVTVITNRRMSNQGKLV